MSLFTKLGVKKSCKLYWIWVCYIHMDFLKQLYAVYTFTFQLQNLDTDYCLLIQKVIKHHEVVDS